MTIPSIVRKTLDLIDTASNASQDTKVQWDYTKAFPEMASEEVAAWNNLRDKRCT
jgi:hypothetical protein